MALIWSSGFWFVYYGDFFRTHNTLGFAHKLEFPSPLKCPLWQSVQVDKMIKF